MSDTHPARALALDALHRELGARMGPFSGFSMPIQYPDGLRAEHLHTREKAGLFDVSHMGQLEARAPDASMQTLFAELERALPIDFDDWPVGLQRYTVLPNTQGGIDDDLMVIRLADSVRLIVNAGNRDADLARLVQLCPLLEFRWIDAALIALQGPLAQTVLSRFDPRAADLAFMQTAELEIAGVRCLSSRSGYTGEDGFEISVPAQAEQLARALLAEAEVAPVGLGARDTLRLEAGLPLHGNDIGPDTSPVEARLGFAVARSRRRAGAKSGGFPGADTILAQFDQGATRLRVGLSSTESVPIRAGTEIIDAEGTVQGTVTSGTISPSLAYPVMMAYLPSALAQATPSPELRAKVRERRPAVRIVGMPFVAKRYKR